MKKLIIKNLELEGKIQFFALLKLKLHIYQKDYFYK
jgi:hypothetical protein